MTAAPAPLGRLRARVRGRDDRGSMSLELVIVFPAVLLIIGGVIQAGLYYHARNLALAAAQEGLRAARVENGTAGAGGQRAREFLGAAGGDVITAISITPTRTATDARITVSGRSLGILPGVSLPVSQTAAGPVERITTGSP